jgi:DNA ligase-1
MAEYLIMKAVEFDKLPAKFKKAHPFEELLNEGYWLQKKYDGCMGIATIRPEFELCTMQSRTGEDYTASTGHLLRELFDTMQAHEGEGFMPVIFIGEVWQPIGEARFPAISGKFRRQYPSPELRFVVNDMLPLGFNTDLPYKARYMNLVEYLGQEAAATVWKVEVAKTYPSWLGSPVRAALTWQREGGFDGGILRNPEAGYTVGTVKQGEIIKLKPVDSLDLKVVRVEAGEGKHAGRAGALVVEYNGVETGVGTGLSDDERVDWWAAWLSTGWQRTTPGAGTIVEVEFLGFTEDGKLREPRFKGIRHDKLGTD